jgi:rhodanese-related sulfurtransferase
MNTTIIDVRTAEEFGEGHAEGSLNIPLHELAERVNEIKSLNKPLILCCASGGRSSMAVQFLVQHEIKCSNGGSWRDLQIETININN